jgi:ribulose-bisphosphate carboxylase large chain
MKNKNYFAKKEDLDPEKYTITEYLFESFVDPEKAVADLCQEQATAQYRRSFEKEDTRPEHGAKAIELEVLEKNTEPKFVFEFTPKNKKVFLCKTKIAQPWINFGAKIPNMLSALAGEGVFYVEGINSIKVMDIQFPKSFLKEFKGPKFGVKGIRKKLQIKKRPLVCSVVKPNIGLKPKQFAEQAFKGLVGGLDMVKDDEMIADTKYSPLKKRLELVMEKLYKAQDKTGEKKAFLANITTEVSEMEELYDFVAQFNGDAFGLLSTMPVGFSASRWIMDKGKFPVIAHFPFIAPFTRHPNFGLSYALVTKLQRMCGYDAIIMPGFGSRMFTSNEELRQNIEMCFEENGLEKTLPAPGGGIKPEFIPVMYKECKTKDFMIITGRGVYKHPMGPEAGAASFRQAIDAVEKGISLKEYAKTHNELNKAMEWFEEYETHTAPIP